MKALILMLMVATYASAQEPTLADFAREERARQRDVQTKNAEIKNIKVYTTEDIRTNPPADDHAPAAPGEVTIQLPQAVASPTTASEAAPTTAAPPASETTATPAADPVQQWLGETEKLRGRIRELMDQEATDQLEINRLTNEVYKPDTNETARNRAQAALGAAQQKLTETREALAKSRLELQKREQDGPPKK
jgi:hypothetical protein